MPELLRSLPSNLQHFNRLLTEYSKAEGGMPVARPRHAIGVVVICSIVDRVRTEDGGYLFVTKGGSAMQMRWASPLVPLLILISCSTVEHRNGSINSMMRYSGERGMVSMFAVRTCRPRSKFPVFCTSRGA